jgi:hypothetical protein
MPQRVPMRCLLSALLNTRLAARRHGAACGHVRLGCWRTAGGTGHSANRVLARSMPTYWYRFRPFRCSDCWWSPTPDLSTAPPTRPRRHRGRWAPMTEDGAEPELLPLDPPAAQGLPIAGRPVIMGGMPEVHPRRRVSPTSPSASRTPPTLCRVADHGRGPKPLSGSCSGLSRSICSAGSWRRYGERAQRATTASATDSSTRTP